mmetsp:Transcript_15225/g.49983  ORF Transcript_15225/g.49983 Transcript_15225/m.49983 type:complete len:513 (+) Transcript_15225:14-1552(+)
MHTPARANLPQRAARVRVAGATRARAAVALRPQLSRNGVASGAGVRRAGRGSVHVKRVAPIRAALSTGGGDSLPTEQLPGDVRERTMKAIEKLGGSVTVGDVASSAGLKVADADVALKAIASDTLAGMRVSKEGELVYDFDSGFRSTLAAKSFRVRLAPALAKAQKAAWYIARVSFGTALVASVLIVYAAIMALLSSRSSDDDDRRSSFRSPMFYISPFDFFWYWDPYYEQRRRERMQAGEEMNFLEAIFSFVFGDGDPNASFEERRWRAVGRFISQQQGVVTAEQLAPFLEPPPEWGPGQPLEENFVLPALLRFQGETSVDEQGNIIYVFPSLQTTAAGMPARRSSASAGVGGALQELRWRFSEAGKGQLLLAAGLGVLNFVGVAVLTNLLQDPVLARKAGSGVVALAVTLLPALKAYAVAFFVIPALRWLALKRTNASIDDRNAARIGAYQTLRTLETADPAFSAKLASASSQSKRTVVSKDAEVAFSTEQSIEERDALEWEAKLNRGRE